VDAGRKTARDFCDNLRDEIRKPLTEYDDEQARLAAAAATKAEMEADELAAYAENDLIDREAKVLAFELEQEAAETERLRVAQERIDAEAEEKRVEQIRIDAEAKATREAAEELQEAQDKTARLEQERLDAIEAERIRVKDAEQAKKDAIEQAEQRARDEADRVERERLRLIDENEREAQARAADKENRRTVNNAIVDALVAGGTSKTAAVNTVKLIATGKVPHVSIAY